MFRAKTDFRSKLERQGRRTTIVPLARLAMLAIASLVLVGGSPSCPDLQGTVRIESDTGEEPLAGAVVDWSCGTSTSNGDGLYVVGGVKKGATCSLMGVTADGNTLHVSHCEQDGSVLPSCNFVMGSSDVHRDIVVEGTGSCPQAGDLGPGEHFVQLEYDGVARDYIAYVPASYDASRHSAVILNLHGLGSKAQEQMAGSRMNDAADTLGFIAVYPNGTERPSAEGNRWNSGCIICGEADDVGFLRVVVDDISTKLCIDSGRVYATGMSNGASMAHRLACEASDLIAGIAPVAGHIAIGVDSCTPSTPISVITYHGLEDETLDFDDYAVPTFNAWLDLNDCSGTPTQTRYGAHSTCVTYDQCDGGVRVGLCSMTPMGHCWPGGDCVPGGEPTNDDIIASEHMWGFFE